MDYISDVNNVSSLCRICLTKSKTMIKIDSYLNTNSEKSESPTVINALENVMSVKVKVASKYPNAICPMCLGLLKISFNLKLQFDKSHKILQEFLCDTEELHNNKTPEIEKNGDVISSAPVELIVGENKYDIKDLIIVEQEVKNELDFRGFLDNLGKSVTAQFVDKSYKYTPKIPEADNDVVLIEKPDTDEDILIEVIDSDNLSLQEENYAKESQHFVKKSSDVEQFILKNNLVSNYEKNTIVEGWDLECVSEKDKDLIQSALKMKYQCKNCYKYYSVRGRFLKHLRNCEKTLELEELSDDSSFQSSSFLCNYCQKKFSSNKKLNSHIRRNHLKEFKCLTCGHIAYTQSALVYHKLRHTGKRHTCQICHKKFYTASILREHLRSHQKIPQVLCPICGKIFNYKNGLGYHMKIHTKERNYSCTYCDRRFYMLNSLKRHTRTHTGIRPYLCNYCDKSFFSSGEAKKHEMLHTGFRPYQCKYCMKGFTSKFNLDLHYLSHPGPYKCDICEKTFIETFYLMKHMKSKHNFIKIDNVVK